MASYDFKTLNFHEFEILVNDLLSELYSVRIERFKPGKDLGIDGRYFVHGDTNIIQSKHYAESKFSTLFNKLKTEELPKIKKILPRSYIVATSLGLSVTEKQKLYELLSPYVRSTDSIFGKDDLNSLLEKYPNIQRNHYKLWISSSAVLQNIIHSDVYNSSRLKISEINDKVKKYVTTKAHTQAHDMLSRSNVVIITGNAGVGKTTLAEQLCLSFVSQKYELVSINEDIKEAFSVLKQGIKQVFYFDDFLGKNFLNALRHKEDTRIMEFISSISKSRNKKFILTSRINILRQGYTLGPSFSQMNIENNEYVLDIENYSNMDKARILYSFLWHCNLDRLSLENVINEKKYKKIILHNNYNPRLLEFITKNENFKNSYQKCYSTFLENSLNNPKEIWEHPYSIQLDAVARAMVDLIVFAGTRVQENELKKSFYKFIQTENISINALTYRSFETVLMELVDSFVNKNFNSSSDSFEYSIFNNSIPDFIINKKIFDHSYVSRLILCYDSKIGIQYLHRLKDKFKSNIEEISVNVIHKIEKNDNEKIILLATLLNDNDFLNFFSSYTYIDLIILSQLNSVSVENLLSFFSKYTELYNINLSQIENILESILCLGADIYEMELATNIIKQYNDFEISTSMKEKFYESLLELWEYHFEEFANEDVGSYTDANEIDFEKLATLMCESTQELLMPLKKEDALDIISKSRIEDIVDKYYGDWYEDDEKRYEDREENESFHEIFDGLIEAKFS